MCLCPASHGDHVRTENDATESGGDRRPDFEPLGCPSAREAGSAYGGVGIPNCIKSGEAACEQTSDEIQNQNDFFASHLFIFGGFRMTRFLSLLTFTAQGIRDVKQSTQRAENFRKSVEAAGGKVILQCWLIGEADGCVVFEAPDDQVASALLLSLGQQGNVRTRTLRVYDTKEFERILAKT
jgi:uncharacterized protein with GYD domain